MDLGLFTQIGILIGAATIVSFIMRLLRQPLIVGHIITGFVVGKYVTDVFQNTKTLELFSHLGIAFLLFSVGLSLNPRMLRQYGKVSVLNTIGQVVLTGIAGVAICLVLGMNLITSVYVGIAISFSSTVIVLKLLADKGDLDKLYVKISIGSLLLQDLIAIVLLFAIPLFSGNATVGQNIFVTLGLGFVVGVGVFIFSHYVIGYIHPYLSSSQELLFLFTIAWAIGISILFHNVGLSLEGGALIAGVALSGLPSNREISARLSPLRDFFIIMFFILLGSRMVVTDFNVILFPALVLSLFVLIVNPLIQLIVMGLLGYRKKTSFQTGMMAAQISEFSLILVGLGVSLGQVSPTILSTVTLVGIITIFISTYFIFYSDKLYLYFMPLLGIFEKKKIREQTVNIEDNSIVLIGSGRVSHDFIHFLKNNKRSFMVIDHDPFTIEKLKRQNIRCEYGDAGDPDFLEDLKIYKSEIIISTIPDLDTNLIILSSARKYNHKPTVWVVAHRISNAIALYNASADYVIMPHFLGGRYATSLLSKHVVGKISVSKLKEKHLNLLREWSSEDHEDFQIDKFR